MFFVGATGQLLTLILTVCLPFVFLFSPQPESELQQETFVFENQKIHQKIDSHEISSFVLSFHCIEKIQENYKTEFEKSFIQKIPPKIFCLKWKSFYAESSGNKAPPSFNHFTC